MIYKLKPHEDGLELVDILTDEQYASLKYEQYGYLYANQDNFNKLDPNAIIDGQGLLVKVRKRKN